MSCIEYYDVSGKPQKKENGAVCAKCGNKFYVARIKTGIEAGFFVNPVSIYYNDEILTKFDATRGESTIQLQQVSEGIFNYYMKFLETKNTNYFNAASRECD